MNCSADIKDLAEALSKAQGQMDAAIKGSTNPYFQSKYADLAAIMDALRVPFRDNGLAIVQLPVPVDGDRVMVETVLLHESGQWISCAVDVPVSKADAQGYGSAMTYAKRYGVQAISGLAAEVDDDGNAATAAKPTKKAKNEINEAVIREARREPGLEPPDEEDQRTEVVVDPFLERQLLMSNIKSRATKLGINAATRQKLWDLHVGKSVSSEQADLAALNNLLEALDA